MIVEFAKKFLVPSWWEIQVTFAAAAFIICVYCSFTYFAGISCADGVRTGIGDSNTSGDNERKVYSLVLTLLYVCVWGLYVCV